MNREPLVSEEELKRLWNLQEGGGGRGVNRGDPAATTEDRVFVEDYDNDDEEKHAQRLNLTTFIDLGIRSRMSKISSSADVVVGRRPVVATKKTTGSAKVIVKEKNSSNGDRKVQQQQKQEEDLRLAYRKQKQQPGGPINCSQADLIKATVSRSTRRTTTKNFPSVVVNNKGSSTNLHRVVEEVECHDDEDDDDDDLKELWKANRYQFNSQAKLIEISTSSSSNSTIMGSLLEMMSIKSSSSSMSMMTSSRSLFQIDGVIVKEEDDDTDDVNELLRQSTKEYYREKKQKEQVTQPQQQLQKQKQPQQEQKDESRVEDDDVLNHSAIFHDSFGAASIQSDDVTDDNILLLRCNTSEKDLAVNLI